MPNKGPLNRQFVEGKECLGPDRRGIIYKIAVSAGETKAREEKQQQPVRRVGGVGLIWKINIVSAATRRFPSASCDPSPHLPTGIELLGPRRQWIVS